MFKNVKKIIEVYYNVNNKVKHMKVIRINKDDFIIYSCLIGAIVFLGIGARDYFASLKEESTIKNELKMAIKEVNGQEETNENIILQEEPESLRDYEKSKIVKEYFDDILDRKISDSLISYDMVKSWEEYEVLDFKYVREVALNYYEYEVNIRIDNKNALFPRGITEILNTEEYNVVTLNIYILENAQNGSYRIRKVEV